MNPDAALPGPFTGAQPPHVAAPGNPAVQLVEESPSRSNKVPPQVDGTGKRAQAQAIVLTGTALK
jgi:hypothetical protein